jgi:hypothetical protein
MSSEGTDLGQAPRWWHCDTHGPGNLAAWGCPECVREMRGKIARMRAALELAAPAMELGCNALRSEAERYHEEMKGYRPNRHQQVDDDCKSAELALQAVVAVLGPKQKAEGQ